MKQKTVLAYPRLFLFGAFCFAAYAIAIAGFFDLPMFDFFHGRGYLSIFIAGMFFSFGFTTPFAIAMFVSLADDVHPFFGALIAAVGAVGADLTILRFARFSLSEELTRLKTTRVLSRVIRFFHHPRLSEKLRLYLLWSFAGLIIASPLPDEIGVTILGSATQVETKRLAALCFLCNMLGVCAILLFASSL